MSVSMISTLLYAYGTFLILCGIVAVIFIGLKAKTALMSGGSAGATSLLIGYAISTGTANAQFVGILISFALFCVFSWRSAKTLFTLFYMIPEKSPEVKGKGIAFLIISLMAVVSIVVTLIQIVYFVQ